MPFQRLSDEVLVAEGAVVGLARTDIEDLKRQALANERRRIRICTHDTVDDPLHEMLIVHTRGAYVRPHKHLGKSESAHVLEGEADVVLFDDAGAIAQVFRIGEIASGHRFYYRIDEPLFHTLLIRTEFFVFHEVTTGPFLRDRTVFAPWSPEETDAPACAEYGRRLAESIEA